MKTVVAELCHFGYGALQYYIRCSYIRCSRTGNRSEITVTTQFSEVLPLRLRGLKHPLGHEVANLVTMALHVSGLDRSTHDHEAAN